MSDDHRFMRNEPAPLEDSPQVGHVFGEVVDVDVLAAGTPVPPQVGNHHVPSAGDRGAGHVFIALAVFRHAVDENQPPVRVASARLEPPDKQPDPILSLQIGFDSPHLTQPFCLRKKALFTLPGGSN